MADDHFTSLTIALITSLVFGSASVARSRFDEKLIAVVKQNISDLSSFTAGDELSDLYALCLDAFHRTLDPEEMTLLRELAAGITVIDSNQDDYLWRTAVNVALFEQDGDLDRLIGLSKKQDRIAALSALTSLCMLPPDERIAALFFDRFLWVELNERNGYEVHLIELNVIADGLKQHGRGEWSQRLRDHHHQHSISTQMLKALVHRQVLDEKESEPHFAIGP